MTDSKTIVPRKAATPLGAAKPARSLLAGEAPAIAGILTTIVFFAYGDTLLGNLQNHWLTAGLFIWLFGIMMWCSFSVVRHADAIAAKLGEPYGTLVLTFAVIIIEVALIASIMMHGAANPTLARDAMFATLTPCSPP
jgi:Ca2+:H+ antiporter